MSFLKTNKEAGGGFGPITPGKYEAIISEVKKEKSKSSGNDMLNLTLTIRSNVEQGFQKRKVFDYLVASEKAMFKFHQLGTALFGEGTEFETLDQFAKSIKNQYVRITIKTERSEYNGETRDNDRITMYEPTAAPSGEAGGVADPFADGGGGESITDNDLPF